MRLSFACAAALAMAACQPKEAADVIAAKVTEAASPAQKCDQTLSATMPFSGPDARDVVTVRSLPAPALSAAALDEDMTSNGALCNNANVVYTIHSGATGGTLFSFITPLARMDVHAISEPDKLAEFLQGWLSSTEVVSTERAPALDAADAVTSSFSPADYTALKARQLPLLCFNSSVHDQTCVFSDPDISGQGAVMSVQTSL